MKNSVFTLKVASIRHYFALPHRMPVLHCSPEKQRKNGATHLIAAGLICINGMMLSPLASAAESLQQAWEQGLKRDHLLASSSARQEAAEAQLAAAKATYFPKLALEAGYLRTESEPAAKISIPALPMLKGASLPFAQDASYFGGVTVSAPLFTSGRIAQGVAAAEAQQQVSIAQTRLTYSELKLAIAQSYVQVLRAEHALQVSHSHVQAVQKHRTDVQALHERGYVARHDVLATEVALANALQWQLQAENGLSLARAAYNRWLGRAYDDKVELQDLVTDPGHERRDLHQSLSAYLLAAQEQRPELQALRQQSQALQHQAASVKASHLPQLGVSAGYNKLENRYLAQDKGWWAGLVMKWELFDGGQVRQQSSQLSANARAVAELAQDNQEKIQLQVRQAWMNQQETRQRLGLVATAVEQADEVLNLARERYRSGLAPNSDVLDAETRRLQAYSNRDNAIYDHELARLQLLYAAGMLAAHHQ